MRTQLPDSVTRMEETAFGDVADLIAQARGEGPPKDRRQVQLILGRWDSASLLRDLAQEGIATEAQRLDADEILIQVVPERDTPVAVAAGGSPRAACHAAYLLLERVLGFGFFLVGDQIPDLRTWKPQAMKLRTKPAMKHRLFLTHPFFAGPWRYCCRLWGEAEWRHMIDWMRRKRFTHMVSYHDEGGYLWGDAFIDAFPKARTRDHEGFVMDPDRRTELNRHIFRYAADSGVSIAYRFMYSVLPQSYAKTRPDLVLHPQPTNSVSVCPGDPECQDIMELFWGHILEKHPPADDQLYLISAYGHRQTTCEHIRDRSVPALDAVRVLSNLDPDGRVFIDAPTTPDPEENWEEWRSLFRALPPEVGVVDWDSGIRSEDDWGGLASGDRPWMPLVHVSRTGHYPPVSVTAKGAELHGVWSEAKAGGACGAIAMNVLANTSSNLSDYAAELGWNADLEPADHRLDYARRRYGAYWAEGMARAYDRMGASLVPELSLPLSERSMEQRIRMAEEAGELDKEWLRGWINTASEWLECACSARSFAMASLPDDEAALPARFMSETAYVEWRALGILALLRSHMANGAGEAGRLVSEAVDRLRALSRSYDTPDLRMAGIPELAKEAEVRLTRWFLEDWRRVGEGSPRYGAKAWLIPALEYFREYEAAVLTAGPDYGRKEAERALELMGPAPY